MKLTLFTLLLLGAGLASAQTPPPLHNVVLTWTPGTGNPPSTTTTIYKSPVACPAAGTDPKTVTPPFSVIATGVIPSNYIDMNSISAGQILCYYVTAVNGTILNSSGNPVPNESGPSNFAQAEIKAAGTPPPAAPTNLTPILQ